MHTLRGSNNRLDEANRERNNANRLFDSQNNNRGGVNVGNERFYVGSEIPISFTAQHGLGSNPRLHSDIILQYMCDPLIRDGTTTTTIPTNPEQCVNRDCDRDLEYGMHERWSDYMEMAKSLPRNKGLFTASQNLKGDTVRYTRQNPNGNRYGTEIAEERDYYPWWNPSPWKDVAIMTSNLSRCEYYLNHSENVVGRWTCTVTSGGDSAEHCATEGGEWVLKPSHGIAPPECLYLPMTRSNHLGNTAENLNLDGIPQPVEFNWTIPDDVNGKCVFRIRYNVTTGDFDGWDPNVNADLNDREGRKLFEYLNKYQQPGQESYAFIDDPEVDIGIGVELEINIQTDQQFRVFQDRSHSFAIEQRPPGVSKDAKIQNLVVRGKRGNIVQVFPSVEYDHFPNILQIEAEDYIHYQVTGSNTNPNNNDGQGKQGTDRSNMLFQKNSGTSYPVPVDQSPFYESVNNNQVFEATNLGIRMALSSPGQYGGELSELDDAGTYFTPGLLKVGRVGTYPFLCTRNNNFSNRSQKGKIIVVSSTHSRRDAVPVNSTPIIVGVVGGVAFLGLIGFSVFFVRRFNLLGKTRARNPYNRVEDHSEVLERGPKNEYVPPSLADSVSKGE